MRVECWRDRDEFASVAQPLIERDPVMCSILAGVLASSRHAELTGTPRWYALRDDHGETIAIAMHTEPYPPVLCPWPADVDSVRAAAAFVAAFSRQYETLPALNGPAAPALAVAQAWQQRTGEVLRAEIQAGVHELASHELRPPELPAGRPHRVEPSQWEIAWRLLCDFHDETVAHEPPIVAAAVQEKVADELLWWWQVDGEVVAVAGRHSVVAGVCRVGPVYTVPQHRRHGYAAALTAHVTSDGFAAGAKRCMLYTDLANPTSNGVYHRLGYRHTADFLMLRQCCIDSALSLDRLS